MTGLLLYLLFIVLTYVFCMLFIRNKEIPWKFKALIYGALTFSLLVAVFHVFSRYDTNRSHRSQAETNSHIQGITDDRS